MKILLTIITLLTAINANAANIEVYQFWKANFGYTCNTSKEIIKNALQENFPDAKFEIINLDKQSSNSVIANSFIKQKAVAILNKDTGAYTTSNIRTLIGMQVPVQNIKENFINEVQSVIDTK